MANFTVSPGVKLNEIDDTFLTSQPVQAGAAIMGPTVKGPILMPTIVTSYSEYTTMFGDVIESGSQNYSYLTSISAYNYFNYGGESLLVTRVASGSFTPATSSTTTNSILAITGATASLEVNASAVGTSSSTGSFDGFGFEIEQNGSTYYYFAVPNTMGFDAINYLNNNQVLSYVDAAALSTTDQYMNAVVTGLNNITSQTGIVASYSTPNLLLQATSPGTNLNAVPTKYGSGWNNYMSSPSTLGSLSGGTPNTGDNSFTLETLSEGVIMNTGASGTGGALATGTKDNVRWEITTSNTSSGTFSLSIRRGDDITNKKTILESFNNLSLDPNSDEYIVKVIGDQKLTYDSVNNQMITTGEYPNSSRFVRVKSVDYPTPNYLDANGVAKVEFTGSIPVVGNGTFGSATGAPFGVNAGKFYQNIDATDSQGLVGDNYTTAISLLSNVDDYKFNVLFAPGLTDEAHNTQITNIITNTQNRGDNLFVFDTTNYGSTITTAIGEANSRDTSYAATYWPWVRISDPATGKLVFVPASTMIPGVYAFNDKVSAPWFAPAGINRGGLSTVVSAEYKLSQGNRDSLYESNINPLATLPRTGVVVYGQKTLQKQASALDRVNVRRLLIELKNFISQIAETVVFEQNTLETRGSFLAKINPYLEGIQQKKGLFAFQVKMDESNNGPDIIDRNQLIGQIYVQPTRTAEFISLDFILQPTGAEFPG